MKEEVSQSILQADGNYTGTYNLDTGVFERLPEIKLTWLLALHKVNINQYYRKTKGIDVSVSVSIKIKLFSTLNKYTSFF